MPSALQQAGALSDPSYSAPLQMNRIFTGIWTNRSPLRDAATPYLQEKFYSASRQDSIWDGLNMEITSKLTLARRAGCSVYNSQIFPAIDRFYEFRKFNTSTETITIIADTAATVYDATGPNTKMALWTKSAGAGKSTFQSVGNTLYFGNGVDQKKYIQSVLSWAALAPYTAGQFLIDTNGNIQKVQAPLSANIISVTIAANIVTFVFQGAPPFPNAAVVIPAGLTQVTDLNGAHLAVLSLTATGMTASFVHANVATTDDTGTVATPAPTVSGATEPVWSTIAGQMVIDGGVIWICKGPAVVNWMFGGPTAAPTLAQAPLPPIYPVWKASTLYSSSLSLVDSNNNIQLLTHDGVTGGAQPTWATASGTVTNDGTAQWTNQGTADWQPLFNYAKGAIVSVTFTYYIQVDNGNPQYDQDGNPIPGTDTFSTVPVTVTDTFICTTAGASGSTQPSWQDGVGSIVDDNAAVWTCTGATLGWAAVGANQSVALEQVIIDANGNTQSITGTGKSGATAPTWATAKGSVTTETTGASWTNGGPYSAAWTAPAYYSYSFGNSVSGDESSRSPLSGPITRAADSLVNMQGQGSPDPQVDTVFIYRTLQGGSSQLRLAAIPAPIYGSTWTYSDTSADSVLNPLIQASTTNYPPPVGLTTLTYHLNRIFGAVDNVIYYSDAIGANVGVSVSSFPPLNSFTFPSQITRMWASSIGLIVFTVSDIYIITGDAFTTALSSQSFVSGIGLLSYDAFAVNGTTIYIMTNAYQIISLDPSAGITESGFPIADILQTQYDPSTAYLTYHSQTSNDTALYAGNGSTGWFRMAAVTAPESGFAWSPRAIITGGVQAIKSVEVTPGNKRLLLGPSGATGPILMRDLATNTDAGTPFVCHVTFGSIVLAQPGQIAGLQFITLDSIFTGTRPTMGLLLGEVSGTFEQLTRTRQDPPILPPSKTLYNDRYNMGQNTKPVWCRHFQMQLTWPAEDAHNELLAFTIFGELRSEFKAG